jgi:alkylhydroperoxidase family enzyme
VIISNKPVSDRHYQSALNTFSEQSLVSLTLAINAINNWNRIAKAFKPRVGDYIAS